MLHKTCATPVALLLLAVLTTALAADRPPKAGVDPEVANRVMRDIQASLGGADAAIPDMYLGSEVCMACHTWASGFRDTLHMTGLKMVPDDSNTLKVKNGVIADYNQNGVDDFKEGLDFNKISSAFDGYKPNAPVLGYKAGKGYSISIGGVEYTVVVTHGGSGLYKQRFLVRIPVTDRPDGLSAGVYYSPIQFNETTKAYAVYEPAAWYNSDNTVKIKGPIPSSEAAKSKSFNKDCVGCHATTSKVWQSPAGEWLSSTASPLFTQPGDNHYLDIDGNPGLDMYNSGCETCHGPGLRHVIAGGGPKYIQAFKDWTPKQRNYLCGSCHSRGKSLPNGKHDYPVNDQTYAEYKRYMGEDLYQWFKDANGVWPDGKTSKQHHQQLQELMKSPKWEFQYHKVECIECHSPHSASKSGLRAVMKVDSGGKQLEIAVKAEDNSLCLACHAGFGPFAELKRDDIAAMNDNLDRISAVVTAHTHHPYNPAGPTGMSRCTECHMAKLAASGAPYDMHSHTFEAVPPTKTLKYQPQGGMPSSCAVRCHRPLAPLYGLPVDANLTLWNEPSDVALAQWLAGYYGPQGVWWQTKE